MLITKINLGHMTMIGALGAGWLALIIPVIAQETTPTANTDQTAPAAITAPVMTTQAGPDAPTGQTNAESMPAPDTKPQPAASNASAPGLNLFPTATKSPAPDPRAGDAPGWWFETALKQYGGHPAFLGARFAESSRAIIIETPNRKLTTSQPLVYQLWICNDLPQTMEFHVEHAVRKDQIFINHTNATGIIFKGPEARLVNRFQQSTEKLAPGIYTIDATLRDQTGNLLHHMKETVELVAPKTP